MDKVQEANNVKCDVYSLEFYTNSSLSNLQQHGLIRKYKETQLSTL
jgi:hypothetical protein